MIPPPNTTPRPTGALAVPVSLLAVDDVTPGQGEETEVPVRLRIDRIENGKAWVTPLAIAGQDLPTEEAGEPMDEDEQLEQMARDADEEIA